jgi:hypothetical protein
MRELVEAHDHIAEFYTCEAILARREDEAELFLALLEQLRPLRFALPLRATPARDALPAAAAARSPSAPPPPSSAVVAVALAAAPAQHVPSRRVWGRPPAPVPTGPPPELPPPPRKARRRLVDPAPAPAPSVLASSPFAPSPT